MVGRVIQAMYREIRGLHQAAYVLALFALGSQLLALIRDRILAHQFGAGAELDIYYTAFRVPDLLYVLFASTLSVYVLIPFVAKRIDEKGKEYARELLSQIFTLFLLTYVVLAVLIALFAPQIVSLFFPGFVGPEGDTLVLLMRVLLLQPFFLGLSSLLGVITQLGHRFVLYALSPLLYNIGIIFGILVLYPIVGLPGLVFGVVIGAIAHMAIQIPFVKGTQLSPHFVRIKDHAALVEVFRVSLPRAVTLSLHQLILLAFVGVASVMTVGSVSVFQFAFNLQSVPLAIIGVSYSVAAFPTLAQLFSSGDYSNYLRHVTTAIRHIFFWSIPTIVLLIVIRAQIVRVILGTGAFDWEDTRLTAAVLALFSVSLVAQAVNLLIVRAFYAGGNTRTPLLVTVGSSIVALLAAVGLYAFFIFSPGFARGLEALMRVEGVPGTEILTLPFGYSIALIVHSAVLLYLFSRTYRFSLSRIAASFWKAIASGLMGGVGSYAALNFLVLGLKTDTFLGIFLQGFLAGIGGIVSVVLTLYVLRSRELAEVYRAFHKRIFRTDIIAPQSPEDLAV